MSAGVGVWKDVLLKAARVPMRKVEAAACPPPAAPPASQAILALVRQIFFPAATVQRRCVVFAAVESGMRVSAICGQVGQALAQMSGATVAIMEPSPPAAADTIKKKMPRGAAGNESWRAHATPVAENVWRLPTFLLGPRPQGAAFERWKSAETDTLPFDYVLIAAAISHGEMPGWCGICDGAVLVLTANRTRKEAALHAKEYLLQCNAELLGTVLDGRTFPVPESIYRRL